MNVKAAALADMRAQMTPAQYEAARDHHAPLDNGGFSWRPLADGTFLLTQAGRTFILHADGAIVADDQEQEQAA